MVYTVSKSQFKPRALEYLRSVEEKKASIIITHYGKVVAKIVPHSGSQIDESLLLRDSVVSFKSPLSPAGEDSWEANK